MKANQIIELIENGNLPIIDELYSDTDAKKARLIGAVRSFVKLYGEERDIFIFSVPGRTEVSGNHTDHNNGAVLAASINKDIIAVAAMRDDGVIRFLSEGYPEDTVNISDTRSTKKFEKYTSASLIAGVVNGISELGYPVSGFDAYATSDVLKGSGISSSAAYEVMIGNIINHLYCGAKLTGVDLAKIARYAENEYFGKPCGLMDQMACAVGGFVYIDFENNESPVVDAIPFSLTEAGYSLCIVNTGGSHADLNEDYASVPAEMRAVAKLLGRDTLRGLTEEDIIKNLGNIRRLVGDRAVLRSLHFLRENERVEQVREALKLGDVNKFLKTVSESGRSSFEYLQNVYSNVNVKEQGIALALALTEGFFKTKSFACRVHGGGFAGTIQVFLKNEDVPAYVQYMNSAIGEGSAEAFSIRSFGAVRIV